MRKLIRLLPLMAMALVIGVTGFSIPSQAAQYWDTKKREWVTYTPSRQFTKTPRKYKRKLVRYRTDEKPGTIVVDTKSRYLYHVQEKGKAMRYGIGVGRDGFTWKGVERVTRKAEWPGWTPPPEMRAREAKKGRTLPAYMKGGPNNPLGARALYLGSTIYRIHGTNENWSIGQAVSSGCFRMLNSDVEYLYEKVKVGTKVVIL
ncbi:L,D-transpeptidase [Rhodobacteraceae bacterium RKSG542]|uniref:L,D-transpeptidase n=1 Tax=Pseudovibrio flavus TaxID=2529854 RepID=UPI0012BCAD51|nr:L,D-transpeptidase [Pseudovibrio flavus]MTI18271.1 L,D-transpeptidase [Pseudovibrio flavus]